MLITFKTLSAEVFKIECDDALTVAEMKQRIADEKGAEKFPADLLRLIYDGKVLSDEQKVADLKYNEKKFVVIMVSKKKLPLPPKAAVPEPASANVNVEASAEANLGAPATQETADDVIQRIAAQMAGNPLRVITPSNELVIQLESMGYPHEEAIRALTAANNDLSVAVEYLVNGIEDASTTEDADQSSQGNLDFLRNSPQFEHLLQAVRGNPALLPGILQQMSVANPEVMGLISANQQEFLRILNEPISANTATTSSEQAQPSQQHVIAISPEDRQAIDRIKAMGFSEEQAVEAYLACERNEMLAANYLINQMEQEGDQSES